jgi:arabinose-5-phosphate isomerase
MMKINILERGRSTMLSESKTLSNVAEFLDYSFVELVELIHSTKGRILFSGVGKNQFVGKKIAATLNSIGKPSLFLHAGDAIHGDLGTIEKNDILVCLSKSGTSPEIKVLIPLVKGLGITLVGIGSDPNSFMANNSDLYVNIPIEEESCPHDLTPTNSTTAYMALGDSIAMCLLDLTRFSRRDFARFHPGGALGRKLYLKVADIYTHNEKPEVSLKSSIRETILEISKKRLGATVVMDGRSISGIVTDGDLRRLFEKHENFSKLTARDAMSDAPKTINPESYATEALQLMRSNNITQLIVTENDTYLGIVHIHDILREGIV